MKPLIENYHSVKPLNPSRHHTAKLTYSGVIPATGARAHIFDVANADHPDGFPISVEATTGGYKVDWESYIQWRDKWLQRFLDTKPEGPQVLYAVLSRSHGMLSAKVPEGMLCFRVKSANPGDSSADVFANSNSASALMFKEWKKFYFAVLELEWTRDGDIPFIRLNRVVRPTWRRSG